MRIFGMIFILILLLATWTGISCGTGDVSVSGKADEKTVELKKADGRWMLYRNGQPFLVKGGAGYTYVHELASLGGNTIRIWDTAGIECILNEAWGNGLTVIVGLEIPGSGATTSFYADTSKVNHQERLIRDLVRRFREHPALLAWCLGNELVFPFRPNFGPFYHAFNRLTGIIKQEDGRHPVTTAIANYERKDLINLQLKVSGIDFISINVYGKLKTLRKDLSGFSWFWDGPYLITEWGVQGGWEAEETIWSTAIENTSTEKARQFVNLYRNYMPLNDSRFLGSLAFYWGAKQEYTHTWFSIFHESGCPTEILEALYDCWNDTMTIHKAVQLKYLLVDRQGARDNIIFSPGSVHNAEVLLVDSFSERHLRYCWEVIKDDWWGNFVRKWEKPAVEPGAVMDTASAVVRFRAPGKEGPYRIFVTVFDERGFCATANIPFYVAGP